jgi:hypothetical protein
MTKMERPVATIARFSPRRRGSADILAEEGADGGDAAVTIG